ncbi:hypothetical protein OESDEN_13507 [Oesophagostomum dentatum]|uniref:Uncharacterized protein n=1 Tax=Oesophagostomum dentatum TaxID=61180 RepID=A0A0B1SP66_OESDE|nr:hypothetical protein OESDEN_13507 [Oesophagostomum dentatum]
MRIGNFYVPTYSVGCFYRTPWSTLMIFSGQFPAFINVFITMERVFALEYATYYRRLWKERYNYYLILLAFLLTVAPAKDDARKQKMLLAINGVIYCFYAMHSVFSLFIYVTLRPDFRRHLISVFGIAKTGYNFYKAKIKTASSVRPTTD